MRCLLDTNVLVRLLLVDQAHHREVISAVTKLQSDGHELCYTAQSLREIWHIGTRGMEANGFGLTPEKVESLIGEVRSRCSVLVESEASIDRWLKIVSTSGTKGAAGHDANHAAIAAESSVQLILTFDTRHFLRFGLADIEVKSSLDI